MAILPESLNNLIEQFQKLPTIGRKSAERLAMSIVDEDTKSVEDFSKALMEVKKEFTTAIFVAISQKKKLARFVEILQEMKNIFVLLKM